MRHCSGKRLLSPVRANRDEVFEAGTKRRLSDKEICELAWRDLEMHILKDMRFVGAMGPPGGGRNPVDPRFVALFNVYNLTPPSEEVLTKIYSQIQTMV